jgi:ParB-like chromosome segregation protein Spo0J
VSKWFRRKSGDSQATKKTRSAPSEPLEFHPLAAIDPLIGGADYAALVEDIRTHGLHEPIVLYQGKILDGRNRARACIEAGVEPHYKEMAFGSDAEAIAFLDSANWHRRHLTPKQKRQRIAARLKADPTLSDRQVAGQTGASHTTVTTVRHELEEAGDVANIATSIDTANRKQPRQRSKPVAAVTPTASLAAKPAPTDGAADEPTDAASTPTASLAANPVPATVAAREPAAKAPAASRDVGPYSTGEHDRLRARIDELSAENRRLEIQIVGLTSEVAELKECNAELEARVAELVEKSPTPDGAASAVAPATDASGADLDVRDFAGGSLRR